MEWNFKNETDKDSVNGYEDVLDELKTYTRVEFKDESTTEERKEQMVEEVFAIYREKNIFPIPYYNEKGIKKEIQKCIDKDIEWEGNVLNLRNYQGSSLCRFLFPNLQQVDCKGAKNNNMIDRFMDDHKLKRAIKLSLDIKKSVTPSEILGGLQLIGGNTATNFPAMRTKALVERYCPEGGVVYDYAAGFGGRMLGVLSSKNDYKYLAVEPNTDTFEGLNTLGKYIEQVKGQEGLFKVYQEGSEDFMIKENYVDFAFSSPPYFSLEKYSDEETQCYNMFPTLEEWFEGYVEPTIENIYEMLKEGCHYAVNIADFKVGKEDVRFVDRWVEMSEKVGFEHVETITMKVTSRVGSGMATDGVEKKEGIYVFKK